MSPPENISRIHIENYQHAMCILFPPEEDITAVCTCQDCRSKLDTLKIFEKYIQRKRRLVKEFGQRIMDAGHKCVFLLDAAHCACEIVVFFQENVSEKVGVPSELEKLDANNDMREIIQRMVHLLIECKLLGSHELVSEMDYFDLPPNGLPIEEAREYYSSSKSQEKAYEILSQIELNEQLHENDKKKAEEERKILDPSISRRHREMQLKLAKMLPLKELLGEIEDYYVVLSRKGYYMSMVNEAHELIRKTCSRVINRRKDFWRQYQECSLTSKGKDERDSHSGFELTLDCLVREGKDFKTQWKTKYKSFFKTQWNTKYESFFNPDGNRNRSDPEGPCGDIN